MTSYASCAAFAAALASANANGWAPLDIPLQTCLGYALDQGMEAVPTRPGQDLIAELRPTSPSAAHPASLSALVGFGPMPLHTDGAALRQPPDFVLLEALHAEPGEDTLLFACDTSELGDDARHGVFSVAGSGAPFSAHIVDAAGNLRFDLGCMQPRDRMAQRAASQLAGFAAAAHRHDWLSSSHAVLIIDNRKVLHGRSAAATASSRTLRRLMIRVPK